MASARETILWRIRRATRDVPEDERPEAVSVERGYRGGDDTPREEIVERFAERAAEYEATVRRVQAEELPGAIEEALGLGRRGVERWSASSSPRTSPENGYRRAWRPCATRPNRGSPKRSSTVATAC
jgi:L-lactate utilization protein LutC